MINCFKICMNFAFNFTLRRYNKELVEYLKRQTAPAFTVVDTPRALLQALAANARTAVFLNRSGAPAAEAEAAATGVDAAAAAEAAAAAGGEGERAAAVSESDAEATDGPTKSSKRKLNSKKSKKGSAGEALDTFEKVARGFRARAEASPLAWVVANMSATAWAGAYTRPVFSST